MTCWRCAELGPMFLAPCQGPLEPPDKDAGLAQFLVADLHEDAETYFAANTRLQLIFTSDPARTQSFLRDRFTGVTWTENRIVIEPLLPPEPETPKGGGRVPRTARRLPGPSWCCGLASSGSNFRDLR